VGEREGKRGQRHETFLEGGQVLFHPRSSITTKAGLPLMNLFSTLLPTLFFTPFE
jgi:hypothetical protein